MPKLTIDLPTDVHKKLKEKAKEDYRSLTNYIITQLIKLTDGTLQTIDTSKLPEGTTTTIKTTTTKPLTPEEIEEQKKQTFLKKCKTILGEKTYKNWEPDIVREFITIMPDSNYYDDAERIPDKGIRMAYSMSDDKQDEYIKDIKEYIDHEEGR